MRTGTIVADWLVWRSDEQRDEARAISATGPEGAAEEWARQRDWYSTEYAIVGGRDEREVLVAPADGSAPPVRLVVTGEAVPVYTARRVR